MKTLRRVSVGIVIVGCTLLLSVPMRAATIVNLGDADSFAVLAGAGITNTLATTITGDVGTFATTSETGFGTCPGDANCVILNGTNHAGDTATQNAKTALVNAIGYAADQTPATTITSDLHTFNGGTLSPGVYNSGSSIGLTGTVTLDGGHNPNAIFVFQAGSSLTTASSSQVILTNGAQACNVFWQVHTAATLGTSTQFAGTLMADQEAITDAGGSTINGRLLASIAAVTLKNTTVIKPTCAPVLHLRKTLTKDNGGTASDTDWTLTATGTGGSPTTLSGTTPVDSDTSFPNATFKADTYTLAEQDGPAGYTASTYSCVKNGAAPVVSNTIILAAGDNATCTINNNDTPAHLIVIKHVVGGSSGAGDFSTTITGVATATPTAAGVESPGVNNTLTSIGAYSIDEGAHVGYDKTLSAGCSGTIALGDIPKLA